MQLFVEPQALIKQISQISVCKSESKSATTLQNFMARPVWRIIVIEDCIGQVTHIRRKVSTVKAFGQLLIARYQSCLGNFINQMSISSILSKIRSFQLCRCVQKLTEWFSNAPNRLLQAQKYNSGQTMRKLVEAIIHYGRQSNL